MDNRELLHRGIKEIRVLIRIANTVREEGASGCETYKHCHSKLLGYAGMLYAIGIYNEEKYRLMSRIVSDAIGW